MEATKKKNIIVMINGDVLNKGQEIKISQGESIVNGGQLHTRTDRFVTVLSSICSLPPILLSTLI